MKISPEAWGGSSYRKDTYTMLIHQRVKIQHDLPEPVIDGHVVAVDEIGLTFLQRGKKFPDRIRLLTWPHITEVEVI
jgi:hypothetical protein